MDAPGEQRIAVPIDDPSADTEWNEILRRHSIIPPRSESPKASSPTIPTHVDLLSQKDLDELDALEDELTSDFDAQVLEQYQQQRLEELSALSRGSVHGIVYHVSKPDYEREITQASMLPLSDAEGHEEAKEGHVILVHLSAATAESSLLTQLWRDAAAAYPEVKFCQIPGEQAIPNFPETNCPTILVYRTGEIVKQIVTLQELGGLGTSFREIAALLVEVGAVQEGDMRVVSRRRDEEGSGVQFRDDDEDDDDWDLVDQ